jgi:trans-aconitate methyltransferase
MEKTISEEYVQQLSQLHDEKASFGDAKGLKAIEKWIKEFKPQSIIDYGCGKGGVVLALKENYSSIDTIGYDPGMVDFNVKPTKKFDMLISTDVLEHIEPVFLDAVLKEMNQYFTKNAFLIIATSPAKKFLPDGRNAHLIVETPGWWKHKLETLMPDCIIHWHEFVEKTRTDKKGNVKPNNKYIVVLRKK